MTDARTDDRLDDAADEPAVLAADAAAEEPVDDLDDEPGEPDAPDAPSAGMASAPPVARHALSVGTADHGERVDGWIAARVPALSRALVQRLIEHGELTINGAVVTKAGRRLKVGESVVIAIPAPEPIEVIAEAIPLVVLFEDRDLIVVDKPAGLVVHPAAGHPRGTLVNALLHHCTDLSGIGGALRPGIVHRLDKDTSGVMVVAKSDRAHAALTAAFAAKSRGETAPGTGIAREYVAIAAPPPRLARGTLRTYYGRHPTHRRQFSSRVVTGKLAVTHYQTTESLGHAATVRLQLETGRTHQIRVHAADHGWPLLGDPLYGKTPRPLAPIATALGRQALHAAMLELDHPVTGARMRFESPIPADFAAAWAALVALGA